ncbi:MAG TPA: tetratricopeptide repeat protein [Holophagaceae bacterium]|jgi:tetratricopeptide (TPR) repeat protein|nr:tetratricopeptide repeat protein [Holophagaceae bacterium]
MAQDPYARYLQQAEELFSGGETVRAGQIWQAVLKQVPDHAAARDGLLRVKAALDAQTAAKAAAEAAETHRRATDSSVEIPALPEPEPVPQAPAAIAVPEPPTLPQPAVTQAMDEDTQDKFLREGCTLYDMGQTEDALRKWDQLLAAVPDHAMALQYAHGARQELGLALDGSVSPSSPPQVHPVTREVPVYGAEAEAADKLLREGCLLYDMGLPEEAIGKWDQAIKLAPYRSDIQSFLDNAHKDIADEKNAPQAAAPVQRALSPADEKVKQAEHLIGMQRFEEAAFTYQQALDLDPGHQAAKAGLLRCRAAQGSPARSVTSSSGSGPIRIEMDRPDPRPEQEEAAPAPVAAQPPAALTKPAPAPRTGLQVPESFDASKLPDWVKDPKLWVGAAATLLVIIGGTIWYKGYARDSQLQADVEAAHRAAVAKAARDAEVPSLAESPAGILSEGKQALGSSDAVRAYLRAQTLLKRNPSDGAAAQLLDQAKASLPLAGLVGATAEEYQQHLHEGDLDQAGKVMDALLRANPDDAGLRSQALRLWLRLAEDHASQGRWSDAQVDLQRGRALAPEDPAWSGRLALLAKIQSMPKGDQSMWIALLG